MWEKRQHGYRAMGYRLADHAPMQAPLMAHGQKQYALLKNK
jgi:hypothetical protein